jgi:hypothetical protein
MRIAIIIILITFVPWLLGDERQQPSGLAGGLLILVPIVLILRGAWLFMGDIRRCGRGDQR